MAFERYEKKGGRHSEPMVSISAVGQITLNRACIETYFKNEKYAHLYFDKEKHSIGISAAGKDTNNAFKLTTNEIQSNSSISGTSFLKHYGVDFKNAKRYTPSWNDKEKMLIVKVG